MKRYVWVTAADESVCPQCLLMEGRKFSEVELKGLQIMPLPGCTSENGCRCKLVELKRKD